MPFCSDCNEEFHAPSKMKSHTRVPIGGAASASPTSAPPAASLNTKSEELCENCEEATASVECENCEEKYCASCNSDLHAPSKMRTHVRKPIGGGAQPPASARRSGGGSGLPNSSLNRTMSASPRPVSAGINRGSGHRRNMTTMSGSRRLTANRPLGALGGGRSTLTRGGLSALSLSRSSSKPLTPRGGGTPNNGLKPGHARSQSHQLSTASPVGRSLYTNRMGAVPEATESQNKRGPTELCENCEEEVAVVECKQCDMKLCEAGGCNADLHKPSKMQSHVRTRLGGGGSGGPLVSSPPSLYGSNHPNSRPTSQPPSMRASPISSPSNSPGPTAECENCEEHPAVVHCRDCDMDLCVTGGCNADLHKPTKMQSHVRVSLNGESISPMVRPSPITRPPSLSRPSSLGRPSVRPMTPQGNRPTPAPISRPGSLPGTAPSTPRATSSAAGEICENCEDETATIFCDDCDMHLCEAGGCAMELHKPAKMKSHRRRPIEGAVRPATAAVSRPSVAPPSSARPATAPSTSGGIPDSFSGNEQCRSCSSAKAEWYCQHCAGGSGMYLCESNGCNRKMHKLSSTRHHRRLKLPTKVGLGDGSAARTSGSGALNARRPNLTVQTKFEGFSKSASSVGPSLCENCEEAPATIRCSMCDEAYCVACDKDLHAPSKMRSHPRTNINNDRIMTPIPNTPLTTPQHQRAVSSFASPSGNTSAPQSPAPRVPIMPMDDPGLQNILGMMNDTRSSLQSVQEGHNSLQKHIDTLSQQHGEGINKVMEKISSELDTRLATLSPSVSPRPDDSALLEKLEVLSARVEAAANSPSMIESNAKAQDAILERLDQIQMGLDHEHEVQEQVLDRLSTLETLSPRPADNSFSRGSSRPKAHNKGHTVKSPASASSHNSGRSKLMARVHVPKLAWEEKSPVKPKKKKLLTPRKKFVRTREIDIQTEDFPVVKSPRDDDTEAQLDALHRLHAEIQEHEGSLFNITARKHLAEGMGPPSSLFSPRPTHLYGNEVYNENPFRNPLPPYASNVDAALKKKKKKKTSKSCKKHSKGCTSCAKRKKGKKKKKVVKRDPAPHDTVIVVSRGYTPSTLRTPRDVAFSKLYSQHCLGEQVSTGYGSSPASHRGPPHMPQPPRSPQYPGDSHNYLKFHGQAPLQQGLEHSQASALRSKSPFMRYDVNQTDYMAKTLSPRPSTAKSFFASVLDRPSHRLRSKPQPSKTVPIGEGDDLVFMTLRSFKPSAES